MLETSATNVIAAAIGRALGGPGEVTVTGGGFRIRPNKAAAACCIGTTGRVFLAVFDGWGTAFERRRMAVQILVDLDWSVDDMVLSALKQVELTLGHQKRQLVRAAAAGIPSPLDLEAFTDPRRLRIDIAAAVALRQHLGSDPAARAWIKDQLRLASGQVALAGRRPSARVHGFVLAVPFLLDPMGLLTGAESRGGRPRWLDNEMAVSSYTVAERDGAFAAAVRAMTDTPLEGRAIVTGSIWPSDAAERAIDRTVAEGASITIDPGDLPERREWRFTIERRLVGVDEAFG